MHLLRERFEVNGTGYMVSGSNIVLGREKRFGIGGLQTRC